MVLRTCMTCLCRTRKVRERRRGRVRPCDWTTVLGDLPRLLTENPREMIKQAFLVGSKQPQNMSEERYESLRRAVMALPTNLATYQEDEKYFTGEQCRAKVHGGVAGSAAGAVVGFFGVRLVTMLALMQRFILSITEQKQVMESEKEAHAEMTKHCHPFRKIREGILYNRPDGISDDTYALLCDAVGDLDEDQYHVDLDGVEGDTSDDEPKPLAENLIDLIQQTFLGSEKPRNMSEYRFERLRHAAMALTKEKEEYASVEQKRAETYGGIAGGAAGSVIGVATKLFGYGFGLSIGQKAGVNNALATCDHGAKTGIKKLEYAWKSGGAGGGLVGSQAGEIGAGVGYVAGGIIGTGVVGAVIVKEKVVSGAKVVGRGAVATVDVIKTTAGVIKTAGETVVSIPGRVLEGLDGLSRRLS